MENEDLSKAVPSSATASSFRAGSSSNASEVAVAANVSKQEVPDEMFVEPAVNVSPTLGSDVIVPYNAESSGKSGASNGVFKMNCSVSSNGIVIGKVVGTLQNSHSFCESAEEERFHHELPQNDSLNGAISLDTGSKQNGRKLDDFACQVKSNLLKLLRFSLLKQMDCLNQGVMFVPSRTSHLWCVWYSGAL